MFFEKTDEILMQFSRNVEGYFLEREAERYEEIEEQLLLDLKIINKEAKRAVLKEKKYILENNFYMSKVYKQKATELMDKKSKVLNKLINKHNIKAIGYHIKESSSGIIVYPLYRINGYSYHIKADVDFIEKNNLKFLGRLENKCNYKTLGDFDSKFKKAINSIDKILK